MTGTKGQTFPFRGMEVEELLHHVESTDANDHPLIRALYERLEEYRQREADGLLDEPAWRLREKALKDDLTVARDERDRMCRWAFAAAIDRLNEGLAVLASPTGPKNAKEFDHNWNWIDFATQEMAALKAKFLENLGRLEREAKYAIKAAMPGQAALFNAEVREDRPQTPVRVRDSSKGKRLTAPMRIGLKLVQHAQDLGRPMNASQLERALREGPEKVHRTTAKTTPGKLLADGCLTENPDGTLSVRHAWHLAK